MSPTQDTTAYFKTLPAANVEALWPKMAAVVPPVPAPKAEATLWKYDQIRPLLEQAGHLVAAADAERRVLMLINPALTAPQTTDTLYAGLQYINPGEVAPAHRHSAFALRFIVEGEGAFTNVEGLRLYMERGDVILTPRWQWHDHGKEGDGPMVWLDGLDLPIFQAIPVNFAEHYEEDEFPVTQEGNPDLRFPWSDTQKALDASVDGSGYAFYEYRQTNGKPLLSIIGGNAERVDKESPQRQENTSFVYHVFEGKGYTEIGDEKIEWGPRDTFCIPAWKPFRHVVTEGPAYLFSYNDKPLLTNLEVYRKGK